MTEWPYLFIFFAGFLAVASPAASSRYTNATDFVTQSTILGIS